MQEGTIIHTRAAYALQDMQVSGLAVPFGEESTLMQDNGRIIREMLAPDCKITFAERGVHLFPNHDKSVMLASTKNGSMQFERKDDGLYFSASIVGTDEGIRTRKLISEGLLDGASIGFFPLKFTWTRSSDGRPCRLLKEILITHLSPVADPAYPPAYVRSVDAEVLRHEVYIGELRKKYTAEGAGELIDKVDQEIRQATEQEVQELERLQQPAPAPEPEPEPEPTPAPAPEPEPTPEPKQEEIRMNTTPTSQEQLRAALEGGETAFKFGPEFLRAATLGDAKGLNVAAPYFQSGIAMPLFDRFDMLPGSADSRIMVYPDFVGAFTAEGTDVGDSANGTPVLAQPKPIRAKAIMSQKAYEADGGAGVLAAAMESRLRAAVRKGVEKAVLDGAAGTADRPASIFAAATAIATAQPALADIIALEADILSKSNAPEAIVFICAPSVTATLRTLVVGQVPAYIDGKLFGQYPVITSSYLPPAKPHFGFLDTSAVKVQPFGETTMTLETMASKGQVQLVASGALDVVYPGACYSVRKGA